MVKYAADVTEQVETRAAMQRLLEAITGNSRRLSAASSGLAEVSQQMGAHSEENSAQATSVASAAQQVSNNITSLSAALEELTITIGEIAKNAEVGAGVGVNAVEIGRAATATINKLGESSAEIDAVTRLIMSIAEQTNLLALNATIEAARAGEAGKGFAVVASEVKELSRETAKATDEISAKVEAIKSDTQAAVKAIEEIGGTIERVTQIQTSIASAVEQQSVTTREMSKSINEAASGSADIASNIASVAETSQHTAEAAGDSQKAAGELDEMAADLKKLVSRYKGK